MQQIHETQRRAEAIIDMISAFFNAIFFPIFPKLTTDYKLYHKDICRNGKLNLSFFRKQNQINTDLELFPTQKQILNLKLYKDNNGKEI